MLKFLGIGSCFNVEKGNTSAYYIDVERDTLFLIDCGESVFERIVKSNILKDVSNVTVLITHLHSDHVGSLASLVFYCNIYLKIKPVIIYKDKEDIMISALFSLGKDSQLYSIYTPREYNELYPYYNIVPVKQKHDEIVDAYGYEFELAGNKIYYSGDTNTLKEEILLKFLQGKYDYFYQDTTIHVNESHHNIGDLKDEIPAHMRDMVTCIHLDSDETIKLAKEAGFNVPNM